MTGAEFLRKLKLLADRRHLVIHFDHKRGKGSHGTIHFGPKRTVLPNIKRELPSGTLRAILKQLGLTPQDLE